MRPIKPSVQILSVTPTPLQLIELAGRTCYKSENRISPMSAETFVRSLIRRGHESVLEHASATLRFICDRGVSHELVRHRLASYSQESTRYCDYDDGMTFIIPPWVDIAAGDYNVTWSDDDFGSSRGLHAADGAETSLEDAHWFWTMANIERSYKVYRGSGRTPEQARSVLPNSLKTEVVMTANFREWRLIFKLRTAQAAHPQMREVMDLALAGLQSQVPIVFDNV